jgi:transcriptional regulator with XRE-family HTH domain
MSKMQGNRIRELREERGWSMDDLAGRVHAPTTAPQISKLEKGQVKLTMNWIERIAAAFDVHPLEIIEPQLQPQEQQLVDLYRGLAEPEQEALRRIMDAMTVNKRAEKAS